MDTVAQITAALPQGVQLVAYRRLRDDSGEPSARLAIVVEERGGFWFGGTVTEGSGYSRDAQVLTTRRSQGLVLDYLDKRAEARR